MGFVPTLTSAYRGAAPPVGKSRLGSGSPRVRVRVRVRARVRVRVRARARVRAYVHPAARPTSDRPTSRDGW